MDKVAVVIGNHLYPYRHKFLEGLGQHYELDIYARSGPELSNFRFIRCSGFNLFGFVIQLRVLSVLFSQKYKKIVVVGNFNYLCSLLLLVLGGQKVISWGFWETKHTLANMLRRYISARISSNILYADSHVSLFDGLKVNYSIARNTVDVVGFAKDGKKYFHIIFVGSLNSRKGLKELLEIFSRLLIFNSKMLLKIVGDGDELDNLISQAGRLGISKSVVFYGRVEDPEVLSDLYYDCFVEVSIRQAGLSVPRALGHGVPFATLTSAVSGGETDSIIDEYNGYKKENIHELEVALCELLRSPQKKQRMSAAAFDYYNSKLTTTKMIEGFCQAI